jgi:HPt (histidine-containing phosphotransfer) domain-containing protein
MRTSFAGGDQDTFARAAHSIKGSAGNLGAEQWLAVAARLEADAKNGIPANAAARIQEMNAILTATRPALGRE